MNAQPSTLLSVARTVAGFGLVWASFSCVAQSNSPTNDLVASWRVTSRLGYGPTPDSAAATATAAQARVWALAQVQAAVAAAAKPPVLPADMDALGWDMARIADEVRALRERRRNERERAPAAAAAMRGELGMAPPPAAPGAAPVAFAADELGRQVSQLGVAWRMQACSSPALEQPLLSKLTEFWFNHFNVFVGKAQVRPYTQHYLFNAIRPHVLGRFEDLLLATAKHPAMLEYLDQQQSIAPLSLAGQQRGRGLNENYARELLELHTLGVKGGYTQTDVRELARVLAGWTIGTQPGEGFVFNARRHDNDAKTVLGTTFRSGGVKEGEEVIRMLARHPETARRVALRLAQWFVADVPSPALVERLSQRFLQTGGHLQAVMNEMVQSEEFWASDAQLFKTPIDFACSAALATQQPLDLPAATAAAQFVQGAGQGVYRWPTPDGYRVDAATWLAPEALTRRADFAFATARRTQADLSFLLPYLSAPTRARIAAAPPEQRAALVLASPDFQRK